jgi:lysozyme family protein
MANFQTCFNWMLNFEDSQRAYAIVGDTGGQAISGINSASFPKDFAEIAAEPQAQRGPLVECFYESTFWSRPLAQIASDEVAKRVFDAGVNMGGATAGKLFQQAINEALIDPPRVPPVPPLTVDGVIGPLSVSAANACNTEVLVGWFQSLRADRYDEIVAANPADKKYLSVWLARAQA